MPERTFTFYDIFVRTTLHFSKYHAIFFKVLISPFDLYDKAECHYFSFMFTDALLMPLRDLQAVFTNQPPPITANLSLVGALSVLANTSLFSVDCGIKV